MGMTPEQVVSKIMSDLFSFFFFVSSLCIVLCVGGWDCTSSNGHDPRASGVQDHVRPPAGIRLPEPPHTGSHPGCKLNAPLPLFPEPRVLVAIFSELHVLVAATQLLNCTLPGGCFGWVAVCRCPLIPTTLPSIPTIKRWGA